MDAWMEGKVEGWGVDGWIDRLINEGMGGWLE